MAQPPRVFVDTNILFSALCFDGPPRRLLELADKGVMRLVVADYVLTELAHVIAKKMPSRRSDLEAVLRALEYETVSLPSKAMVFRFRKYVTHDEDAPVLASAVLADADYVVSGDEQFYTKSIKELVNMAACSDLVDSLDKRLK